MAAYYHQIIAHSAESRRSLDCYTLLSPLGVQVLNLLLLLLLLADAAAAAVEQGRVYDQHGTSRCIRSLGRGLLEIGTSRISVIYAGLCSSYVVMNQTRPVPPPSFSSHSNVLSNSHLRLGLLKLETMQWEEPVAISD
ncbi:hypothetical protein BDN70DRAFT_929121 [Pholiota conissans]|uniref:Uncharacterized protein n=1 Tax=Pholiota conissans TaxID=109636 RepID=A0A9P5Z9J2_9AGAR|nr:hypothetical protein BDN70DRAFT_929121 [Pholiota conissans]